MAMSNYEKATRGKSRFLSLEYALAVLSSVLSLILIIESTAVCISLWNGSAVSLNTPLSWVFLVSSGYVGAVSTGVGAVIASVVSYILFGRVSRTIPKRPRFTKRLSYKLITYGALGFIALLAILLFVGLIGILLTSILLIGSESSISSLYIDRFMPAVFNLGLILTVGYMYYLIVTGKNASRILSQTLLSVSSLILLALIITVAIRSHDGYSSNDYGRSSQSVQSGDYNTPFIDGWYWGN